MSTEKKKKTAGERERENTFLFFSLEEPVKFSWLVLMIYNSSSLRFIFVLQTRKKKDFSSIFFFLLTQLFVKQLHEGYHMFHNLGHCVVI